MIRGKAAFLGGGVYVTFHDNGAIVLTTGSHLEL